MVNSMSATLGFITETSRCLFRMLNLRVPVQIRGIATKSDDQHQNILEHKAADMPAEGLQNPFHCEKSQCILCRMKIVPDYKNVKLLSQFVSPYTGRIYGRHITRLCTKQQERVVKEIMKAQSAGLMAYYLKDVAFIKDSRLFDPERPIRPHRF